MPAGDEKRVNIALASMKDRRIGEYLPLVANSCAAKFNAGSGFGSAGGGIWVRLYAVGDQSKSCEREGSLYKRYFVNPPVNPVYAGPVAVFVLLGWIGCPLESVVNEV